MQGLEELVRRNIVRGLPPTFGLRLVLTNVSRVAVLSTSRHLVASLVPVVVVGLVSEEIDFFVLASLAMKLREYTRNTPIRRNPVSKF